MGWSGRGESASCPLNPRSTSPCIRRVDGVVGQEEGMGVSVVSVGNLGLAN